MTLRPFSQTLQQQFRDTLGTPGAPDVIDDATPVQAVAVVATVNTATSAGYTQVTDGTDTLAINTNGSINVLQTALLPSGGTFFNYSAAGTGANVTAHTVTAGKTAYVVHFSGSGTANGYVALMTSADVVKVNLRFLANTSAVVAGPILGVYAATTNIRVVGSAATVDWNIGIVEI